MNNLARSALTLGDFFRLSSIERVSRTQFKETVLYLFTGEGLLPEGQRLAIDDEQRMVGVYQDDTLIQETQWRSIELFLLTALVLSFPYSISTSQIEALQQALAMLARGMDEMDAPSREGDPSLISVPEMIAGCNRHLLSLGMAIVPIDTAYKLVAERSV